MLDQKDSKSLKTDCKVIWGMRKAPIYPSLKDLRSVSMSQEELWWAGRWKQKIWLSIIHNHTVIFRHTYVACLCSKEKPAEARRFFMDQSRMIDISWNQTLSLLTLQNDSKMASKHPVVIRIIWIRSGFQGSSGSSQVTWKRSIVSACQSMCACWNPSPDLLGTHDSKTMQSVKAQSITKQSEPPINEVKVHLCRHMLPFQPKTY